MDARALRRLALLAVAFFVLSVAALVAKTTLFSWDPGEGRLRPQNALYDEGGCYVAQLHVMRQGAALEDRPWFRAIRDQVSDGDLLRSWGPYGPRSKYVFTAAHANYVRLLGLVAEVAGDLNGSYGYALLLFPFFLLFKYLFALGLAAPRYLLPVAGANLLHDLLHVPGQPTSEPFAVQILLLGLSLLLFGRPRRWIRTLGWVCMGLACLLNPIPGSLVLALAATWLPPARRVWTRLRGRFLQLALCSVGAILLLQILQLGIDLLRFGPRAHYSSGVTLFVRSMAFADLLSVALLLLLHWAPRRWPELDSPLLDRLKQALVWLYAGAILLSAAGPWIHYELWENTARLQRYVLVLEAFACAALLPGLGAGAARRVARVAGLAFLLLWAGAFLDRIHSGQPHGWSLRVERYRPFAPSDYPTTGRTRDGRPYFTASSSQQVYGYFLRRDYDRGPLVLDLRSRRYRKERVLADPGSWQR